MSRSRGFLVLWMFCHCVCAVVLAVLGRWGGLVTPDPILWHSRQWVEGVGPDVAVLSLAWVAVLLWCVHVLVALAWTTASAAVRSPARPARIRGVPLRLVSLATRAGRPLVTASVLSAMAVPMTMDSTAGALQGLVAAGGETPVPIAATGEDAVVMVRLDLDLAPLRIGAGGAPRVDDFWLVEPGDHLWAIAADQVANALGDRAFPADIDQYWRRLIAANTDRLVVPEEPDLVYPGQRLRLPPVTSHGARSPRRGAPR